MIVGNLKHKRLYRLKEDISVSVEVTEFQLGQNHAKIAADNCLKVMNGPIHSYIVYTGTVVYPKDSVIVTTLHHQFYCPRTHSGKPVIENAKINPLLIKIKQRWDILEGKEVELI